MATSGHGRKPLSLMVLPVEVREVIYQHIFSYSRPLYTVNGGRLIINREARHDMQCLRTCRAFYREAMPQIYAMNTLEIEYKHMSALTRIPRDAEILAGNVTVYCNPNLNEHQTAMDGRSERSTGEEVEEIDFGLLGKACPNMSQLSVCTYSSGSLLWVTQKLLKSLPCSLIREWPLLRVDVEISGDDVFDNANFGRRGGKLVHSRGVSSANLGWLNARSSFRLGHEIPRYLRLIEVRGMLSRRLCRMLEDHVCAFGDCSFQKEKLQTKAEAARHPQSDWPFGDLKYQSPTASLSSGDVVGTLGEQLRYTWHKTGKQCEP